MTGKLNMAAIYRKYICNILYDVDVAVITETHLKKKHADSCVDIDNYALF
jgi:hypothetical protein